MASITLQSAGSTFPPGTSVAAYPLSNWNFGQQPPTGAPVGSATETQTVASAGTLAYSALADDTKYVAYAQVGSEHRYLAFRTTDPTATRGSYLMAWAGSFFNVWDRVRTAYGMNDAEQAGGVLLAAPMNYNGATWDRQRGNSDLTALASAARTANTQSADLTNFNASAAYFVLDVTAGATLSLTLKIEAKDPLSGKYVQLNASPTAVTGVGTTVYAVGLGMGAAASGVTQVTAYPLPRTFRVNVTHGNANSATYSVGVLLAR